jgi:hypothetical protein
MSNAKEILNRVYDIVMGQWESTNKVDLAQQKTADGAAIFDAESFDVGQAVFIVTEEGNIPVPMGEYILEEGLKITVDEQGVIVEVNSGESLEEEEIEAQDEQEKEETGMMNKAKKVVKSKTEMEETYFKKNMKKTNLEEIVEVVEEVITENEVITQITDLIDEATPESITPEIAEEIAIEVISEIIDIIESAPEGEVVVEMMRKIKNKKKKLSKQINSIDAKLSALAKENEELRKALTETPAPHTKFNPEAETQRDIKFRIGAKRGETIQDRVFNSLF